MNEHEKDSLRNPSAYERLRAELEQENETALNELREAYSGREGYWSGSFNNPRMNSTPLPVRADALRANILRNKAAYNKSALRCMELELKVGLDELELKMVQERLAERQLEQDRRAKLGLYKGHRSFMDWIFDAGIDHRDLLALRPEEAIRVANFVKGLLGND